MSGLARLRAPTVFSMRMKSASAWKTRLWIKAGAERVCFHPRSPIAYGRLLVRAQSAIRAVGPPSAQVRSPQLDVCAMVKNAIDDPRGRFFVRATP
jgi:hypothetical protein